MKLNFNKMFKEEHFKEIVYEGYGCWISTLWGWGHNFFSDEIGRDFTPEEDIEAFLFVLQYLLDTEKAFLEPPGPLYNVEKKMYDTKTRIIQGDSEEFLIWDIPTNEMMDYMRENMPSDPDYFDENDAENTPYWYSQDCPHLIWGYYQEDGE